jgi:hypothetical protein
MTTLLITRTCLILLVFGLAASSLTMTARVSRPAPRQSEEQGAGDAKQSNVDKEGKEAIPEKKIVTDPSLESAVSPPRSFKRLGKEFLLDQEQIWTSPAKLRFSDAQWLVPLSGITAGLFVTDTDYSKHLPHNPTTTSHYSTVSSAGIGALIGGAGGMWVLGHVKHNEHWSETGFLAGEAALNSLAMVESLKYSLGRERPYQGNGTGPFFQSGTSFPSEHAAAAWSVAGVIAHEYPSPFMKVMAYGLASLVDYSRIRARQHFPSDVFVGSIMGNLVAQNIYTRNHDPGLGGEAWKSISQMFRGEGNHSASNMGSPYVTLDSWVYSALDRLTAMNYVQSSFLAMRPWTRLECARLTVEAESRIEDGGTSSSEAEQIYDALRREFSHDIELLNGGENNKVQVESVYTRFTEMSGQPLSQGYQYDFGQSIVNDYGRPYEEGANNVTGFSGWATEGILVAYVSGEYQYAPSAPPITATARQIIASTQEIPEPPALTISSVNRFKLLDAYVGITLDNWEITFGRQSLWWGPGAGGSMMFSNNAEPINMFRINRVSPFKLPSILGWMGPMRVEFFLGQLSGQSFVFAESTGLLGSWTAPVMPQPMINGLRFSFKPTSNVEFGFSRTGIFAGQGVPFTMHTFLKSFFSFGNTASPGVAGDPGDRRSGFDLTYRLPKLRNWMTFYADGFADDQFSPVAYWDRSAWNAGIYLSHFPTVPKLDLRVEGVYSDLPAGGALSHGFFYWNDRYRSGYTNDGNLLGSWIGRESQGAQAWTTYHFTPRNLLQLNFRHQKVSQEFIPGGGTLTDFGARCDYQVRSNLGFSAAIQHERWLFPVITPGVQKNVSMSLQLVYWPDRWGSASKN